MELAATWWGCGAKDRLKAFTAAKESLRTKYPDPFHWAPFLYFGSPD